MGSEEMKGDFEKKTLNLRPGDWEYLESIYKPNGIATSLVIRTLISQHVDAARAKETKLEMPSVEMEL
jgi:hypothetical protein